MKTNEFAQPPVEQANDYTEPGFDLWGVPTGRKHFYVYSILVLFVLAVHSIKTLDRAEANPKRTPQAEAIHIAQMLDQAVKGLD